MTNFWFIVTATGTFIIVIAMVLTPTAYALAYVIGTGMACTGMAVSVCGEINRKDR